jgi:hypothetical protein
MLPALEADRMDLDLPQSFPYTFATSSHTYPAKMAVQTSAQRLQNSPAT